ncbi:hypothetical protein D3C86_1466650 [compost metagenome]
MGLVVNHFGILKAFKFFPESIYRQSRKNVYRLFFNGMDKLQPSRMQTNASFTAATGITVFIIAYNRAVHGRQLYPDLVRASRQGVNLY